MQFDLHHALLKHKLKNEAAACTGRYLDVGSGDQPYRKCFPGISEYLTTNTLRHYSLAQIEKLKPLTTFWIDDGKQLPAESQSLDGILCFQVLSVIENPLAFFAEINRVLKPGGRLLLTTDYLYPAWSEEDVARYPASELKKFCLKNGFENIRVESFGGFCSMNYALVMRYLRSFPGVWKRKKMASKILSGILYAISLLLMPLLSVAGYVIFLAERNELAETGFTFNLLLTAQKPNLD